MKPYNILFLCTHNSSRSILAEALATTRTNGKFIGQSAGSTPGKAVNPFAHELALELGYPAEKLRSKSWDEFARPDAPHMDFIITVCDDAAGEVCPVWLGHPVTAHWGLPDPSKVQGSDDDKRRAYRAVLDALASRIRQLAELPVDRLTRAELSHLLRSIHDR